MLAPHNYGPRCSVCNGLLNEGSMGVTSVGHPVLGCVCCSKEDLKKAKEARKMSPEVCRLKYRIERLEKELAQERAFSASLLEGRMREKTDV